MKKIIYLLVICLVFISGCTNSSSPRKEVLNYLKSFSKIDDNLKNEIQKIVNENDEFSPEHKELYKEILINQYKSLEYSFLSEEISGDKALVRYSITVNDLNKADDIAFDEVSKNMSMYYNDKNEFDNNKYITDKLEIMKNIKEKVNYEVTFYLYKEKKKWILKKPTDDDLEKLHGIYMSK